ncbi:SRPBCC domain-containing protein [Devosia rhodophyticola]|uniref:SRPBCC domain-containing protein n=1 Tax=Devosia rhodophyticola TaxID=3026423 RepID=A0ABY7YZQ2_9HYPH|nr:SRPBCC domain-containing protein [Devosia rhodophyticola]WDR06858.1 SRPBCC domain-containing protein [Devosia rhodophyticola]
MTDQTTTTRSVVIEREIACPPEKLWRALTQPLLISEWLMSNDFQPDVGHRFKFSADWGSVDCAVTEVEPQKKLAYKWDAMGLESTVTWTLTATIEGTHLRMEQAGFRADQNQAYNGAKFGWQQFFGKLEEVLAKLD